MLQELNNLDKCKRPPEKFLRRSLILMFTRMLQLFFEDIPLQFYFVPRAAIELFNNAMVNLVL